MRKTLIDIYKSRRKKDKSIKLPPAKSKDADYSILKLGMFWDIITSRHKTIKKVIYKDDSGIVYLPLRYVEFLHEFIIKLYIKSEDPVVSGYMSKDNLDYAMDQVKYMYNGASNREEKLIKKAGFIMYNIASKHPFTDGNKRTSIITCNSFLEYNGYTICDLPYKKSKKFITEVAMGKEKEKDCQKFIRNHISKNSITKRTKKEIQNLHKKLESLHRKLKSKKNR